VPAHLEAEVAILRDDAEAIYAEDRREVWRLGTALVRFRGAAEVSENRGALGWVISAADRAESDAILARHRCLTVLPAG
jgi:hypothetical protein